MAVTIPILRLVLNDIDIEFSGEDVLECTILQESNPIGAELPISTATVTIYTEDPRFSIFSDGEFYQALTKHLSVDIFVSVDDVEQRVGFFYLDSWEMETENTLKFELIDALGVCASIEYPGSFWETDTAFSVIVEEIMSKTQIAYNTDILIRNRVARGWIPPSNVRDALQQLCFATRSTARTDHQTRITFVTAGLPLQDQYIMYPEITDEDKTGEQTVKHLPKLTEVVLISHDYYNPGIETPQTIDEIFNAWLEPGNYIISFPKPYWKVWGEGAGSVPIYIATEDERVIVTEDSAEVWGETARVAAESETFVFSSNYASVTVDVAGQVTIWGYPWLSAERPHKYFESEDLTNSINIENAMLVSSDIASNVLEKVVEYYKLRYRTKIQLFPKYIILGSIYVIDSFHNKQIIGVSERFEIDLVNGYIIDATFTGMENIPVEK